MISKKPSTESFSGIRPTQGGIGPMRVESGPYASAIRPLCKVEYGPDVSVIRPMWGGIRPIQGGIGCNVSGIRPMRGEIGIRPHESGIRPMRGGIRLHLRQALNVLLRKQATTTSHRSDSLFTLVFSLSLSLSHLFTLGHHSPPHNHLCFQW
jgi:hypothetical protein